MNLPNENQLTIFRKYFYESVMFALTTAVIYLFIAYNSLNQYIRDEFIKSVVEQKMSIQENTKVLQETQSLIKKTNEQK